MKCNLLPTGLLCLACLLAPLFSFGQMAFTPLNGPFGGRIFDMAERPDGALFLSSSAGVFRSADGGDTWVSASTGLSNAGFYGSGSFAKLTDGTLFLQSDALYRYDPNIAAWKLLPSPPFSRMAADSQNRLWANAGSGATWISEDAGANFTQVLTDMQVPGSAIDHFCVWNDDHGLMDIWLKGVYHFNRAGQLTPVTFPKSVSGSIAKLEYHPATGVAWCLYWSGDLFRSVDGGINWLEVSVNGASGKIAALIFDANDGAYIYAYDNKIYFSKDNGASWNAQQGQYKSIGVPQYAFLNKANQLYYYGYYCSKQSLSRSDDLGVSWKDLQPGFRNPEVQKIVQDRQGRLYMAGCTDSGWSVSTDQGQNWEKLNVPGQDLVSISGIQHVCSKGTVLSFGQNAFRYSLDGGTNWLDGDFPTGSVPGGAYNMQLAPDGTFYCFYYDYAASKALLNAWTSVDEGQSWQPLNIPAGTLAYWWVLSFHPNGDLFFPTDSSGQILHYMAGKDSARVLNTVSWPYRLGHIDNKGYLYFISANNSSTGFISRDLGNTVKSFSLPFTAYIWSMASNLNGDLFVATERDLYRSRNEGASWELLLHRTSDQPAIRSLHISPDQYLYVGFQGGLPYRSEEPTAYNRLITGSVWLDENGNCTRDPGEPAIPSARISAQSSSLDLRGYSGYDGKYILTALPGDYKLNVQPQNALHEPCTTDLPFSLPASADTGHADLPLRIKAYCPYMTVAFSTPFLRRCFDNTYSVSCCNQGTVVAKGAYVTIAFDSLLNVLATSLPYDQAAGNVYTFQLGDLAPEQCVEFTVKVNVSCMAELGREHCVTAHIYPDALCIPGLDSLFEYTECQRNRGSFDPNDKQAFVGGREESEFIEPGTPLEYLIRFQNTGTDTAFRVVVEDRISPWLDINTLRVEAASHPYRLEQEGRLIRFVFENILLPDSTINEAASHGFVKFRIAQSGQVLIGGQLTNLADIFFDYNDPVRTNVSRLSVGKIGPPDPPGNAPAVFAAPNPFRYQTYLRVQKQSGDGEYILRLFDAPGRLIREQRSADPGFLVERQGLPAGVLFYTVETNGRRVGSGKLLAW